MAKEDGKLDYILEKLDDVSDTCSRIDKEVVGHKVALDEHIKQDEKMYEEFKRMNDILQQNTDSLKEHMLRSEMLEHMIVKMDSRLSPLEIKEIQRVAVKDWLKNNSILMAKLLGAVGGAVTLVMLAKTGLALLLIK